MKIRFHSFSKIIVVLVLLASACSSSTKEAPTAVETAVEKERKNVLYVTLDTTRRDWLGCYGSRRHLTPHLDSFAADSVVFLDARTQVPVTLPSHVSMMTGMSILEHGVRENGTFVLKPAATTLAEVLQAEGYRTAAFVSSFVLDERFGLSQGFETYDDEVNLPRKGKSEWQGHDIEGWERTASKTTTAAIKWLKAHTVQKKKVDRRPFFMWVHFYDPHQPWEPPEPWKSRLSHPYSGEVAFMDSQFGRLINFLKKNSYLDDTLIVVASDHGESLGRSRPKGHGRDLYDVAMRAVLIMRLEGALPTDRKPAERTVLQDVPKTIIDVLGIDNEKLPGRSMRPLWSGEGKWKSRDPVYMETMLPLLRDKKSEVLGLVNGHWKLVLHPRDDKVELYDLKKDRSERSNLAEKHPGKVEAMSALVKRRFKPVAATEFAEMKGLDQETAEKLEALGYIRPE